MSSTAPSSSYPPSDVDEVLVDSIPDPGLQRAFRDEVDLHAEPVGEFVLRAGRNMTWSPLVLTWVKFPTLTSTL
jgi:hypothetical protein